MHLSRFAYPLTLAVLAPVALAGNTADINISATIIKKNTCQVDSSTTSVNLGFGNVDVSTAFTGGGWSHASRTGTIVLRDCDSSDVSTLMVTTAQTSDSGNINNWLKKQRQRHRGGGAVEKQPRGVCAGSTKRHAAG